MSKGLRLTQSVFVCAMVLVVLVAAGASSLSAQAVTANISGTVTDSTGAVIAGAQVVVTNTATGAALTLTSNDQGRYNAPDLVVGPYEVRASKAGFQTVVQSNINANVGSQLVVNLSLPVGQAQQTVTVETSVAQVETQSTELSALVSPQQMVDLPLNGRNFEQLLNLAPGVTPTGAGTTTLYGTGPGFSIAGARTEGELFLLDDTNMSDFWNHQAGSQVLGTSLGIEAIQEFRFLTNTYSSQFGGNGAVMNAASKSGTNDFHGSAYEFLRNDALDSRSYFEVASDLRKLPFRRNQFGGSLGGPIKKNKLFFFANYEGFRQALDQPVSGVGYPEPYIVGNGTTGQLPCGAPNTPTETISPFTDLPAPNTVNNVSATCSSLATAGGLGGIWPSVSGIGTGSNPIEPAGTIGSGAIGQTAAAATALNGIMGIYNQNAPTRAANAFDEGGYYFTTISSTQVSREDYVLGRVDYTLSSTDNIFGRYVFDRGYNLSPLTGIFGAVLPLWPEVDHSKNQFFTAEERHIFSSNVVNNARFMFIRTYESSFSNSTLKAASDPLNFNPARFPEDAFVSPDFFTVGGIGSNQFVSDAIAQNKFGAGDDVAWNHGAHTITFGAEILRVQSNVNAPFEYGGDYIFLNLQNFVEGTPFVGYAVANSPYTDDPFRYFREIDVSPYINDSWKVTPRLTLNLGVRYEYGTNPAGWPLYTILNPPFGDGSFAHVNHVFQSSPNRKNIDPRVGLAWSPFGDQKTSVRAGYGIFHDPVAPRTYASAYYFDPPFNYHQFAPGTMTFPNAFLFAPPVLPPQDVPTACAADNLSNNSIGCTSLGDGVPFNTIEAPYQQQWNLNIQRDLGKGMILTVGYVGSRGVHLFVQRNLNPSMTSTSAVAGCGASLGFPFFNLLNACSTPTGVPCVPTVANGNLSSCVFGAYDPDTAGVEPILPRVNDNYAELNEAVTKGNSNYNSLQVSLVRQAAKGITMQLSYTYSHCLDDGSGTYGLEEGATGQLDPYDPRYDYGNCGFDLRHNFVGNVIYQLPFHGNRLVEGWQVSGIFTTQTGTPFSVSDGFDAAGLDNNVASTRPDVVPGCNPYVRKGVEWLTPNPAETCFALEPIGTLGNARRDSLFGPRFMNLDFALLKNTKITERLSAQFRAEFFNIANRSDFEAPDASVYSSLGVNNPLFGLILATIPNSQREIQFGLKLIF